MTKTTIVCIEILQNDVNSTEDGERVRSAYKSLVEIYMSCMNIDRNWLPLFRKAFESVLDDQTIRDHCKVYIKYLKILRNLNEYEMLMKSSVQMLEIYPTEYIPLDMICWIYVNDYHKKESSFEVSCVKWNVKNKLQRNICKFSPIFWKILGNSSKVNRNICR